MHKADLSKFFSLLPEQDQEEAIVFALELILARGEWPLITDLHEPVMRLHGHAQLRAHALAIQIKAALRLRQIDLAFERYQLLLELGRSDKIISIQAETLMQMAIQILPAKADRLSALWEQFISLDMPSEALESWAKTGILLYHALSKNREESRSKSIREAMRSKFPESFWNRIRHKLENK